MERFVAVAKVKKWAWWLIVDLGYEIQDYMVAVLSLLNSKEYDPSEREIDGVVNPDLVAWICAIRLVKAWIIATISEEALGTVVCLTTSCNVWKALSSAYLQNSQAREFELLVKLQEKKTDSTSLNDYIKEFKSTCDRFNAIGKPVPNQNKVEARHTVLIHTVAAGVGYLLYQWENALGATVIGTVSTEEKATQAKEMEATTS
ncbi:hypothetical protein IFM89_012018 [Coptis chinensis]|uniref:Retrotransposon gag domain-containing protein n=1 Tax=Coptis chinensis TaxID=261450 RepID=A0A835MI53_9MAGN|nr:hypothetical protein IFM89_012018 [Coptis chinensis]